MEAKVFTPETIAQLEKQHGKLVHIKVYLDDKKKDVRECVIKDPTELPDLSFLSSWSDIDNSIQRGEYVLDNLWVDGHEDFRMNEKLRCNNTKVRFAGVKQANMSIKFLESEVVKH